MNISIYIYIGTKHSVWYYSLLTAYKVADWCRPKVQLTDIRKKDNLSGDTHIRSGSGIHRHDTTDIRVIFLWPLCACFWMWTHKERAGGRDEEQEIGSGCEKSAAMFINPQHNGPKRKFMYVQQCKYKRAVDGGCNHVLTRGARYILYIGPIICRWEWEI